MSDDPELAKWRAQRMAQMQGGGAGAGGAPGRSQQDAEQQQKKQECVDVAFVVSDMFCDMTSNACV